MLYSVNMNRLEKQIDFIIEIDGLKKIIRKNYLSDCARLENSAEHSWYFAIAAMIMAEHGPPGLDINKVIMMALIHDIVEIDAGDLLVFDEDGKPEQKEKENQAAERLFGILPEDQSVLYRSLWQEFEESISHEARYAKALDRFSAFILNYSTDGKAWREHNVTASMIREKISDMRSMVPMLWEYCSRKLDELVERKLLSP